MFETVKIKNVSERKFHKYKEKKFTCIIEGIESELDKLEGDIHSTVFKFEIPYILYNDVLIYEGEIIKLYQENGYSFIKFEPSPRGFAFVTIGI